MIKSEKAQNYMREGGKLLGLLLSELKRKVRPGLTTLELNSYAEKRIAEMGSVPSFKGYMGFPATLCTSINEEVVHTIPSNRILKEGDIISIDCGIKYQGYHTDSAITVAVGKIPPTTMEFMLTGEKALEAGIRACKPGNFVKDISKAIQEIIEKGGYSVVRELTGHGVGSRLHEDPHIPNYQETSRGLMLKPGMTLAIEPIFAMGNGEIQTQSDGWNIVTKDKSLAIQIEHTILVTRNKPEILTKRP